jgi:hypothetical protein
MATLPKEYQDAAAAQRINITLQGQAQQPTIIIGNTDSVSFYNGAPFPVSIQFICANGPVFNDIARIDPNSSSTPQYPQETLITTDYQITNLNTQMSQGPYAIQVGGGPNIPAPLLVPLVNGDPPTNPNMSTVSVPLGGWIEFSLDQQYTITWTPAGAFNTPNTPIGPGMAGPYRAQTGNQVLAATYNPSPNLKGVRGGTVNIGS